MAECVNVAVDAMGGDNAPTEIVKGAVPALCVHFQQSPPSDPALCPPGSGDHHGVYPLPRYAEVQPQQAALV